MLDCLLVGRGPSVHTFDWSSAGHCSVMAVSSGIFALPEAVIPEHFTALDAPKYFLDGLWPGVSYAWHEDVNARHWSFWREPGIQKHVLAGHCRNGHVRHFPGDALEAIPAKHQPGFIRCMAGKMHEFGYQPAWGDYPNVTGWELSREQGPNFTPDGPLGLDGMNNSFLFALQVAHRLGYRRLGFIGIDLLDSSYDDLVGMLEKWHALAIRYGNTWTNLSPDSKLREFMPSMELAA